PLLLGLGVHELSVSAPALPRVKNVIRHLSIIEAQELAEVVLACITPLEVEDVLEQAYQKIHPYL
ncbi:MAG TPA: phosphoenolpyruvate--protein phosphotransferase, partial [Waddliaceae bacterium]